MTELGSILKAPLVEIHPDEHGDWLNQRRDDFGHFIRVDSKKTDELAIFENFSCGIKTNRDPWSYNSSKETIGRNFTECIAFYNAQVEALKSNPSGFERNNDETKIKWNRSLDNQLKKKTSLAQFSQGLVVQSLYRPFFKQFFYNDKAWIEMTYQMPLLFPFNGAENLVIGTASVGSTSFSCLMSAEISDLHVLESGTQCFPRYLYRKVSSDSDQKSGGLMAGLELDSEPHGEFINGYERVDAIRPEAVEHFKAAYPEEKAFEEAGRALAKLHVGYESVEPYADCTFSYAKGVSSDNMDYRVYKLKYGKNQGKKGNAAKDKTVIVYNKDLTIRNIPAEVQEYVVNKKSALDWVVERCGVSVDKASQITNDYNKYAEEMGDERYILNLILRVITVSLETVKIVKSLPPLSIHKLDQ